MLKISSPEADVVSPRELSALGESLRPSPITGLELSEVIGSSNSRRHPIASAERCGASPWCRTHRHWSLREQQQKLNEKLRGHFAYYGVTGNSEALSRFKWEVQSRRRKWHEHYRTD
jgi:hypothetical protein